MQGGLRKVLQPWSQGGLAHSGGRVERKRRLEHAASRGVAVARTFSHQRPHLYQTPSAGTEGTADPEHFKCYLVTVFSANEGRIRRQRRVVLTRRDRNITQA